MLQIVVLNVVKNKIKRDNASHNETFSVFIYSEPDLTKSQNFEYNVKCVF